MKGTLRLLKFPANTKGSLRLAAGATFVALTWHTYPSLLTRDSTLSSSGEVILSACDGVARASRALFVISSIVVDYKCSLWMLPPDSREYRSKLSEIHIRAAKRLLKLCEVNGGFYVKAGQFVSALRHVPKEYTSTLSSLQDQAKPYNIKDIKELIIKSLGEDSFNLFLSFDEKPMAAASIAQVHHGILKNNQEVAIKVQYPGLEQRMKIDISTMDILSKSVSMDISMGAHTAQMLNESQFIKFVESMHESFHCRVFSGYKFDRLLSEFKRMITLELDFIQEGKNSERAARNFKNNEFIRIPHVYWDLTTNQVLTMEFCRGCKVDDLEFLKDSGVNNMKVAQALIEVFAEMIFDHGFVHGDPHPGNILVSVEGIKGFSLVLLDHGIYRELDKKFMLDYCKLWKALILMDSQNIINVGERFGVSKYSKYFPLIFTGRTLESKSPLGAQMSKEEKKQLKRELQYLSMEDISLFMEALPPEFLFILRADGMLTSISSKLGAPRRMRLLTYAKHAICSLATLSYAEPGDKYGISKFKATASYLQLRAHIEILAFLLKIEEVRHLVSIKIKSILFQVSKWVHRVLYLDL